MFLLIISDYLFLSVEFFPTLSVLRMSTYSFPDNKRHSFWILSPISLLQSNLCVRYLLLQSGGYTAVPHAAAAAAAAKSLQSCLTLCNPIDGSLPGSPVPGSLQARTLEWVAISFNISMDVRLLCSLKVLHLFLQNMVAAILLCFSFSSPFSPLFCSCRSLNSVHFEWRII